MTPTETRNRPHFTVIDALLILLFLLAAAFAFFHFSGYFNAKQQPVSYVLRITGVSYEDTGLLKEDDDLIHAVTQTSVGTVVSLAAKPQTSVVFDADANRYTEVSIPDRYTLYVNVQTSCPLQDGHYLCGNDYLSANHPLSVLLPFYYDSLTVLSVLPQEA